MNVQPSVKRRSKKGYFTRIKGRLVFKDKSNRRMNTRAGS